MVSISLSSPFVSYHLECPLLPLYNPSSNPSSTIRPRFSLYPIYAATGVLCHLLIGRGITMPCCLYSCFYYSCPTVELPRMRRSCRCSPEHLQPAGTWSSNTSKSCSFTSLSTSRPLHAGHAASVWTCISITTLASGPPLQA
jgi:hypothetical protein